MKKSLLTICFLLFVLVAFSQTLTFGVKAGLNLSSQSLQSSSFDVEAENLTGFHLGGIIDIVYGNFSIQPGLLFSTKGEKITAYLLNGSGEGAGTSSTKVKLNYLELPVNLLYKAKLNQTADIFLGGGPYIGYGLSGTISMAGNSGNVNFGDSDDPNATSYKNPDYGVNFTAGAETNNIIISANYGLGLSNLSPAVGAKLNNKVISFSIGYLFR